MRTTRLDFFRDPMGSQIHQKTLYFREFIGPKKFNWTSSDGEGEDHTELPFQKIHDQCKYMYYDINDIAVCAKPSPGYEYTAIHLNIHSLPSKYGQLTMLADFEDNGIFID